MIQAEIDHGADVNATNKNKETALMVACVNKNESAINVLLKASANPNTAIYGSTSLHRAVRQECSNEVIQALIDNGADVNKTNMANETALTLACATKYEGTIKCTSKCSC